MAANALSTTAAFDASAGVLAVPGRTAAVFYEERK